MNIPDAFISAIRKTHDEFPISYGERTIYLVKGSAPIARAFPIKHPPGEVSTCYWEAIDMGEEVLAIAVAEPGKEVEGGQ